MARRRASASACAKRPTSSREANTITWRWSSATKNSSAAGPANAPTFTILDGKATATLLLGPPTGSTRAALDALTFEAGAVVPAHVHDASDELLYVVSGKVELTMGGRTVTAGPGDAILVPQGVEHAARAVEAAKLVQVYVGPGPEERFRAGTPRKP